LGHETEVGGGPCGEAQRSSLAGRPSSLHVQRAGAEVSWAFAGAGATAGPCVAGVLANARVSIGLRGAGGAAPSVANNLRVLRVREP
ncbi:MAG: hypothetical protein ACREJ3_05950, partial [Polyangiaceae bacterium]